MNGEGTVISGHLPPGNFSVRCLLDGLPSNTITYRSGGGDGGVFQVHPNTGALSLADGMELDYETSTGYRFSVTCSSSSTTRTDTAQVDFRVLPVNEFEPVLSRRTLLVPVREDVPIGTIIVSTNSSVGALRTYSATDEDSGPDGELEYTLAFNENLTSFAIDPLTGTVTVEQILDVDFTPSAFFLNRIRLTVCDIKPPTDLCPNIQLTIFITSANDNDPVFAQDIYRVRIAEGAQTGSIIANVSCTDADFGVGQFQNVTSSSNLFNVTLAPNEQTISLNSELDFETARVHNVTLTCYDNAGKTARATLLVTVEPLNDNPPVFSSREYYFTMSRILTTGNEVGRVLARDADEVVGGTLTYTMQDNENFQIQGDGTIILNDFVYVVEGQVFTLSVTASDGEFSDSASVVITVNGVLSVPEIIIVAVCAGSGLLLCCLLLLVCCCCFCCIWRRKSSKKMML